MKINNIKKKLFYLIVFALGVGITSLQIYKITPSVLRSIFEEYCMPNFWYVDAFIIVVDIIVMILGTICYPYINYKLVDKNEDIVTKMRKHYEQKFNDDIATC